MRVIVLTSTFTRHHFVANRLASRLPVVGVWQEAKSFKPEQYGKTADDRTVIDRHFAARDASEATRFKGFEALMLDSCVVQRRVSAGGLNEESEVRRMADLKPDVAVVFGTGILKGPILQLLDGRLLNIHLGLSPYYRGSGTNFWPLVNREPEFVGATIHYLDAGIDTGPIVAHVRPQIRSGDDPHDIGNEAIKAAADKMVDAVQAHRAGTIKSHPQVSRGRLYQRKDFSADAVRCLYEQFRTGIISEYLEHKVERDARLDLVSLEAA